MGDSFSQVFDEPRSYLHTVCRELGLGMHPGVFALGASSLDHLFMKQWMDVRDDLRPGDHIIVTLTNPDRTYFFEKNYKLSMASCTDTEFSVPWMRNSVDWEWSDDQRDALARYYLHLHDRRRNLLWLESWLYQLDSTCRSLGTKAIVIDCFPDPDGTVSVKTDGHANIIRAFGSMSSISVAEYGDDEIVNFMNRNYDMRMNHMLIRNHAVLAEKLVSAWGSGNLDLTSGFHERCFRLSDAAKESWFDENCGNGGVYRDQFKKMGLCKP